MSKIDPEKLIEEFEAEQAKLDAELEKLGLGSLTDFDQFDEMDAMKGYPDIVRAAYDASNDTLVETLSRLIAEGADVNASSPFGETALTQCFQRSTFDAMRLLLANGADHTSFEWSEDHLAIAMGEVPDIAEGSPALNCSDSAGRTPFLLACRVGNIPAMERLEPITNAEGKFAEPDHEGPILVAARSGAPEAVDWLVARGYDLNAADRFGGTALLEAVDLDHLPVAQRLLDAGADWNTGRNISKANAENLSEPDEEASVFAKAANMMMKSTSKLLPDTFADMEDTIMTPANSAHSPDMLRLLAGYGVPLEEFDSEDVPTVTGLDQIEPTSVTPQMFAAQANPRKGTANPERVNVAFWHEQMRTGRSGYGGETECLGERNYDDKKGPVWSFDRFGRTGTRLPDGRWVLIAGEHEDHYDPDYYIYSDVTVVHPDTSVDHYIYPRDVFPPTDFHTATLVQDQILLIGNLGYPDQRQEGETQVLSLSLADFSIRPVETTGQKPGWISRHKAVLHEGHIMISGGKVEPGYRDNTDLFVLDVTTNVWSRAT